MRAAARFERPPSFPLFDRLHTHHSSNPQEALGQTVPLLESAGVGAAPASPLARSVQFGEHSEFKFQWSNLKPTGVAGNQGRAGQATRLRRQAHTVHAVEALHGFDCCTLHTIPRGLLLKHAPAWVCTWHLGLVKTTYTGSVDKMGVNHRFGFRVWKRRISTHFQLSIFRDSQEKPRSIDFDRKTVENGGFSRLAVEEKGK